MPKLLKLCASVMRICARKLARCVPKWSTLWAYGKIAAIIVAIMIKIVVIATLLLISSIETRDRYFGSTTTYAQSLSLWNNPTTYIEPNCTSVSFVMYSRHATRNPNDDDIISYSTILLPLRDQILKNVNGTQSNLDKQGLADWIVAYDVSNENKIVQNGVDEMIEIGTRYKSRFQHLINEEFNPKHHEVIHTTVPRAINSAKSFMEAVYGQGSNVSMKADNKLLRFYKTCKKWKKNVDNAENSREESDKFLESRFFQYLVRTISERLGFSDPLSTKQVMMMHNACKYDYATKISRESPWCSVFGQDELDAIEYYDDMEFYWTDSYGNYGNYEQACPPVRDLMKHIRGMVNGNEVKRALFRFTHQGFLQKFYARLGLFRDESPLKASLWSSSTIQSCDTLSNSSTTFNVNERKLRLSKVGPFSANIAFVVYNCSGTIRVKVFVQEHQVRLPGCHSDLCSVEELESLFGNIADNCDLNRICKIA